MKRNVNRVLACTVIFLWLAAFYFYFTGFPAIVLRQPEHKGCRQLTVYSDSGAVETFKNVERQRVVSSDGKVFYTLASGEELVVRGNFVERDCQP